MAWRDRSEGFERLLIVTAVFVAATLIFTLYTRDARWRTCSTAGPDARIETCTKIIESGYEPAGGLSRAYSNRGAALHRKGDAAHAMEDYDEALRLSPANSRALHNRGIVYGEQKQYDRAIEDFDRAIKLDPVYANAWNARCWTRILMDQLPEAVDDCTESLRLRAEDGVTLGSRALAYLKLKQADEAIADYTAALKTAPKNAASLFGRGLAKQIKGDASATADIAAAQALNTGVAKQFEQYGVSAAASME